MRYAVCIKGEKTSISLLWFPGWLEFIENHSPAVKSIYLSLGKKEEKTRNKTMAAVGDNIRRQYDMLIQHDLDVTLEWNEGNHFTDGTANC